MNTTTQDLVIRRGEDRGQTRLGWLESYHSFSFNRYIDPQWQGFRSLRVLNDDRVAPAKGFGEHGHANMEILTWVLSGALRHGDSLGNGGVIRPGELQVMSAGAGILHSEMNDMSDRETHFLQVWIIPEREETEPGYTQRTFDEIDRKGRWQLIASGDGRDRSLRILQDARVSVARLEPGQELPMATGPGRHFYLHVSLGGIEADQEHALKGGDALMGSGPRALNLKATADTPTELMLFDLA